MEHHHYGMGDLRHFMNPATSGGNLFTPAISHPELLSSSTDGHHHHHQNNDDDQLAAAAAAAQAQAQSQSQSQSQAQQLEMLISSSSRHQLSTASPRSGLLNHHHHLFRTESSSGANNFSIGGGSSCLSGDGFGFGSGNGSGRWPRQETLTLLEVRSRLDSKFKEANQKGPLWDQVSRYHVFQFHSLHLP